MVFRAFQSLGYQIISQYSHHSISLVGGVEKYALKKRLRPFVCRDNRCVIKRMPENKRRVTYRIYPSKGQEQLLLNMLSLHQQLYNMALEQRIKAWRSHQVSVSYNQQAKDLTELRAAFPEYKALNAQASQNTALLSPSVRLLASPTAAVLKRLDRAFQSFFSRLKQGLKAGFPRFKAFSRYRGWGYNTYGDGWKLFLNAQKHGHIRLSGVGHLQMRGKAKNPGVPKTLDILCRQGNRCCRHL